MLKSKILLRNVRDNMGELRQLMEKRDWLYGALLPKGITYKSIDVQESGPPDPMAEKFAEIYELDNIIENRIKAVLRQQAQAEQILTKLEKTQHKQVIELYYLSDRRLTWQQVAKEMGYSEREIYNIHGEALLEMEKIIENGQGIE